MWGWVGGGVIHFHFPALKLMYRAQVPQVTDVLKSKQLAEKRGIFYSYTCSPSPQEAASLLAVEDTYF